MTSLIEQFIPLANKLACQKKRKLPKYIEIEELRSVAYLGLVEAASRYKESKGAFMTFVYPRICGAINDYLRALRPMADIDKLKNVLEAKTTIRDDFFDGLSEYKQNILRWYFFDGYTMKEIGQKLDLTEGRISQLISECKKVIAA